MTTRKTAARSGATLAFAAAWMAFLGGCATPGPLHIYGIESPTAENIHDTGPALPATVSSFRADRERIAGFAYDPFTDHFFVRLAGGTTIRVVDRPDRSIKRTFEVEGLSATGGDLAIRPRDGHVFFLQGRQPAVLESTRLGKAVRSFALAGVAAADGLAYDAAADRLLVLHQDRRTLTWHDTDGKTLGRLALDRAVAPSLAYDFERREIYAPLDGPHGGIGIFGLDGQLRRHAESGAAAFVDVGPRSFLRVF